MTVFDANTFGPDEVPVEMVLECEYPGYSTDVLIDIDGNRKEFRVGWYDFDSGLWRLHDYPVIANINKKHMRWQFLPLAIYDTNPELRKTVKI